MTAAARKNTHAQSLNKDQRLSEPSQFKAVFSGARRSRAGIFSICSRANACGGARLGLAVSVKAAGNAVARNRLKRLARESFRRHRARLPARDYVVGCAAGAGKAGRARSTRHAQDVHHLRRVHQEAAADLHRFWEKEAARS